VTTMLSVSRTTSRASLRFLHGLLHDCPLHDVLYASACHIQSLTLPGSSAA